MGLHGGSNIYRMTLNLGGDDITEAFYVLLQGSCFPYKEMDLTRGYDWNLMQDLKHQYCTFIIVSRELNQNSGVMTNS